MIDLERGSNPEWDGFSGRGERIKFKLFALPFETITSRLAQAALMSAVFFAPFRYRRVLFEINVPPVYGDYTDGLLFLSDIFLLITLILWAASNIFRPRKISLGPAWILIPLGGMVIASAGSVVFSVQPALSFYHLVRLLLYAGLYFFVINEIHHFRHISYALAASVTVQATTGIAQWLAQADLGLQALGEYELNPAWNGVSIVWGEGGRALRAYGLSDHPNILGGVLAFSLIVLIFWQLNLDREGSNWASILATGIISIGMVGLFVTFSRSAWLALIVALTFGAGILIRQKRREWLVRSAAFIITGATVLFPMLWDSLPFLGVRFNLNGEYRDVPYEQSAFGERVVLNEAANTIFAENALTGVGIGAYPVALRSVKPDFGLHYQPPHMVMLEVAAETGIFGALFFILASAGPWIGLWIRRKQMDFSAELVGAYSVMLAIIVVGLFDYYPWLLAPGRFWTWLSWGMWASAFSRSYHRS